MDSRVTGAVIKKIRTEKSLTQRDLADKLNISDKTVSRWETGKGYPDITMVKPLAEALGISVEELFSGSGIKNSNKNFNMNKIKFYVCPLCGNMLISSGEAVINCCGITLEPLSCAECADNHEISAEESDDEYYVTVKHEMTKEHYISFITAVQDNGFETVKLYPEGNAEARLKINRTGTIYYYCSRHGLFKYSL